MSVMSRLSLKEQLRIFLEGLKDNATISGICRRKEIWPKEYYRIKEKALAGALEAPKNSRRKKKPEKKRLRKETDRLRHIVLEHNYPYFIF